MRLLAALLVIAGLGFTACGSGGGGGFVCQPDCAPCGVDGDCCGSSLCFFVSHLGYNVCESFTGEC